MLRFEKKKKKKKNCFNVVSFHPSDATALKHIIVWNCLCVWPELKSLLPTPDPELRWRKTAEAKWEERQSSG